MTSFFLYLCITLFIIVCVFLILIVLIQKGRGGGLASAFGGAGGNTAFGSKTGDVLTWVTSIVFAVFLLLAISLNLLADRQNRRAALPLAPEETPVTETATDEPTAPLGGQALPPETTPAAPTPPAVPTTSPEK